MLAPPEVTNGSFIYFCVTLAMIGLLWGAVYAGQMSADSAKYGFDTCAAWVHFLKQYFWI